MRKFFKKLKFVTISALCILLFSVIFSCNPTGSEALPHTLNGLTITGYKNIYNLGESFSTTGMTIQARYADNTSEKLSPSQVTFSMNGTKITEATKFSDSGTFKVLVEYSSVSTSFSIRVLGASEWRGPSYPDDYVSEGLASWSNKDKWNLANTHDPTVFKWTDGYYYMFGTDASYGNEHDKYTSGGHHFQGKRSKNLVEWEWVPGIMDEAPDWIVTKLNEFRTAQGLSSIAKSAISFGYWAPCARVIEVDGTKKVRVRMYYSIVVDNYIGNGKTATNTANFDNTWGERAFIGVAETTNPNGGPSAWTDLGFVVCSSSDRGKDGYSRSSTDDWDAYFYFNAIDPTYFIDDNGTHWMIYGSWHSGFALVRINPATGKVAAVSGTDYLTGNVTGDFTMGYPWSPNGTKAAPKPEELITQGYGTRIYTRKSGSRWQASEGPELIKANGYYYLFFANDGLDVPYQTRVVRSKSITGPYTDIRGHDFTDATGSDNYPLPMVTHPYKFLDEDNTYGSNYGWVGISHCALFQDESGDWYYMSQQRLPANVANNAYSNAIMMGGVRKIIWAPSNVDNTLWPIASPERYGGGTSEKRNAAITEDEIPGEWQNIDLGYNYEKMDTATSLILETDGTMSGAFTGTWSFDEETSRLTFKPSSGTAVTVCVEREIDWELNPRIGTLVYAGIVGNVKTTASNKTYWGKQSISYKDTSSEETIELPYMAVSGTVSKDTTVPKMGRAITSSTGASLSFKIKNYTSDFSMIFCLYNENIALPTMHYRPNGGITGESTGWVANVFANEVSPKATYEGETPWTIYQKGDTELFVTISYNTDGTIVYYLNGAAVVSYAATSTITSTSTVKISDVCSNIISDISATGMLVHTSTDWASAGDTNEAYTMSDLVIGTAVDADGAKTLYSTYGN